MYLKAGDLVFYRGPGQEKRTGIIVKQLSRPKFIDNQACVRVLNQAQLLDAIEFFASDREAADKYVHRAREVVEKNKGSTEVQASYIISQLGEEH